MTIVFIFFWKSLNQEQTKVEVRYRYLGQRFQTLAELAQLKDRPLASDRRWTTLFSSDIGP
jgi:hypothetical protein